MHLLATETGTLDEIEQAVDLAQSPADVVVLSFSDSDLAALASVWSGDPASFASLRLASLKKLRHPMSVDLYVDQVASLARLVIVRSLGGLDYWRYGFDRLTAAARRHEFILVALAGDDRPDPRLTALSTADPQAVELFDRYFREGGPQNTRSALLLSARLIGRDAAAPDPPVSLGAAITFKANGKTGSVRDATAVGDRPAALVTFYRSSLLAADTGPIVALLRAMDRHGIDAHAIAVTSLKDPAGALAVSAAISALKPRVIVNATAFSALRGDQTSVLDEADCPVLQVALAGSTDVDWRAAGRGLSPTDLAMNVVLPELDGRIFTRAISFKSETSAGGDLQFVRVSHQPEPTRIDFVAALAAAWIRLGRKPPADRRVAIMLSDYPARGGRTGYACGLDTAASLVSILGLLSGRGYTTRAPDDDATTLMQRLSGTAHGDTFRIPLQSYDAFSAALPRALSDAITASWGAPASDPAIRDGAFEFPVLRAGNVTVLLQPDRGSMGDRKAGYHDTLVPPRHAYVALYAALRQTEKIDALIHLGTHGTLEWLPGKALALSAECAPEAVLGPVPVIYPFIVNNPGEAVQAKRRIAAVTIGHLTPVLSDAGLAGPLGELEGLIEEYAEASTIDRRRASLLEREIVERAWRSGLAADCGIASDDAPQAAIAKLDAQLCDIKDLAIRDTLHVFGVAPTDDVAAQLAVTIARSAVAPGKPDEPISTETAIAGLRTAITDCARHESAGLLAALDGRRVAPGPSGAPTRGRADVLPTGRNLTTIDPRGIPTRTAAIVGHRAADEVVRRYLQDHGDYPRALMLDMWASASLRTGGDDLAQALAYLGARPVWDHGSSRVTGVEVLALAQLDRPRIDVTLRLSGLFRDIFQQQIALFAMAVDLVSLRDEDETWNPLAAARRRGEDLARAFGNVPGGYGAGTAETALDGTWSSPGDLAAAYLASSSHAYGRTGEAIASEHFVDRIAATDALVHPQDDRERDLLDGDGVADFVGGFAAAANEAGRTPALYHLDTSATGAPKARTISEEITRLVRGRLTNQRWIAGMLRHGHRGVAEMAQAVDALYAFAAAAGVVPGHLFDAVHDALLADDETARAVEAANPAAAHAMAERLQDAVARGLWTPRRNAVHGELARLTGDRTIWQTEAAQ